jgi:hypothetical protein
MTGYEVEVKALYQCPECGKSRTVTIRGIVKPKLTVAPDMRTTVEAYELQDVRIEPVGDTIQQSFIQDAIKAYKRHDTKLVEAMVKDMNEKEKDAFNTAIKELNANRSD